MTSPMPPLAVQRVWLAPVDIGLARALTCVERADRSPLPVTVATTVIEMSAREAIGTPTTSPHWSSDVKLLPPKGRRERSICPVIDFVAALALVTLSPSPSNTAGRKVHACSA